MEIISTAKKMQEHADAIRRLGKTIGLVPTMGFLHEGHLSLMQESRKRAEHLVVSLFVNPTQFGPTEDFDAYPRDFERDVALAEKQGVDVIFAPTETELYTKEFQTYVILEKIPNHLCGISRPTHFRGVATVVAKLFNIVKPDVAVFGRKDYQQLVLIRRMAIDLNFGIEIVGSPTVREPDGLAMSSRNSYLTPEQRLSALSLYKSLKNAQKLVESGEKNASRIIEAASKLIKSHKETHIDYISICDPETLVDMDIIDRPAIMALAVKVGKTRLIDNMMLNPSDGMAVDSSFK
jgi:pantoate--beta-alanine ligase